MKRTTYGTSAGGLLLLATLSFAPLANAAPPDDGFEVEDESDDGFAVDESELESPGDDEAADEEEDPDVAGVEGTTIQVGPASPDDPSESDESTEGADAPDDDGEWEFEVEDISDDPEALEADLKEGEVQATGKVGTVSGSVLDSQGEPIAGAYVEAAGTKYLARTGVDGRYTLDLPPGAYTLVAREELHQAIEQPGVEVESNATSTQDFKLVPQAKALVVQVEADANVEGDAGVLLKRQKNESSVDAMSREEISRSGGGKIANVARFIVGATVVDGRFVFVRGLGHRYGNTLLDGARVPSPEPELRTVPMDIFPSGALGAINVQKSFTPDVPGDFAGGSLQLVTREIPRDLTVSLGVELEANTVTTFRPMLTNGGFGATDFFGFGNGPRGLSNAIPTDQKAGRGVLDPNTFQPLYTDEEIESQGESMYTDTRIRRGAIAPINGKFKFTVGKGWNTKRAGTLGFLVSGSYANSHKTEQETVRRFAGADGDLDTETPQVDFNGFKTKNKIVWSTLALGRWDVNDDHRIEASTLYSRDATDETREQRGIARGVSGTAPILATRLRYIMRSVWFNRLGLRHKFPVFDGKHRIQLDYFGSYSQARRDDPAIREMLFLADPDCDLENVESACAGNVDDSAGSIGDQTFLGLRDDNANGALNLEVPFDQWSGLRTSVKFGAWAESKWREFGVRRFNYQIASGPNDQIPTGTGNIINADTIGSGMSAANGGTEPLALRELTRPIDNYRGRQTLYAGYGMLTLPFANWVRLSGGARLEASEILVQPFDPFADPDAEAPDCSTELDEPECLDARLVTLDVLPSASLIFSPKLRDRMGAMNVRLMGSQTLARPELRELAPFVFTDFVGGFNVQGNPDLQPTKIWNAELRWEWFPKPTEVVAVSAFYKYFDLPIEQVVNSVPTQSFVNAKAAVNIGAELELRKNLEFFAKKGSKARPVMRQFSAGANFAYVFSRVELFAPCYAPGDEPPDNVDNPEDYEERPGCRPELENQVTSRERPLQGQSPWVVNAFVDYDNQKSGTFVRALVNMLGPSIYAVGAFGVPDMYEVYLPSLDLVFSQRLMAVKNGRDGELSRELRLNVSGTNLLNLPSRRIHLGDEDAVTLQVRKGADLGLGLSWSF